MTNRQEKLDSILSLADKDPYPYYEQLRKQGSPIWDEKAQAWLVLDYDQCATIAPNNKQFGNIYVNADPILAQVKGGEKNITFSQGEEHTRLRRLHQAILSRPSVEVYREKHIRPIIKFVFNRLLNKGKADLLQDVTAQIVPRVICSLLGMPYEDDAQIKRILELNDDIFSFVANSYRGEELKEKALVASAQMNAILRPYVEDRRDNPKDDLISRVWQDAREQYGDDLSVEDAIAICRELYFGGSDTTLHASASALYLLVNDPELYATVKADRKQALQSLIEEALRLYAVVQIRHRLAKQDVEINGVKIKQGQMLFLVNAAANRDEKHYKCPMDVDLQRKPAVDHLAFGRGQRSCVGAVLARAEMEEIINAVLDYMPNIRIDPEAEPARFKGTFFRSFRPINVLWNV